MNRASLFLALFTAFAFAQETQPPETQPPIDTSIIVEIITNPAEAFIYINKEKLGISPAAYMFAIPGVIELGIQKENYEPWDTTLTIQPSQRLRIDHTLKEKSIFSKEGEIDLQKILAKDTTTEGYRQRKDRVLARIGQIDSEMSVIYANFASSYPALEPQKPKETVQSFEDRKTLWQNEFSKQTEVLKQKYETYRNSLLQSYETLEKNITEAETLKEEMAKAAAVDASKSSGEGLGWRGWTRILTFTAAAACGAVAVMKHREMKDSEKEIADLNKAPSTDNYDDYRQRYEQLNANYDEKKSHRNIFGAAAGVFVVGGTLTFVF